MSDEDIHALPVGHEFDGYRILRVLGPGGLGITYLAEEIQIGRKVAIKEYLPSGFAALAVGQHLLPGLGHRQSAHTRRPRPPCRRDVLEVTAVTRGRAE